MKMRQLNVNDDRCHQESRRVINRAPNFHDIRDGKWFSKNALSPYKQRRCQRIALLYHSSQRAIKSTSLYYAI